MGESISIVAGRKRRCGRVAGPSVAQHTAPTNMSAALQTKPESELLSISEIARRCGINRATAAARLDDLGYEADESSTQKNKLFAFDDEMLFAIKAAKDSLSAAKIRDIRASSQLKELKLAEARGELVPMHEAIDIVQKIVGSLYQEFVIRQPKRVGIKLAKAKSVPAVKKVLKLDTDRIMKQLRENFEQFIV